MLRSYRPGKIRKSSLHYYHLCSTDIWQSFSFVKCLFCETESKTEHPSCLSWVFHRREMHIRL